MSAYDQVEQNLSHPPTPSSLMTSAASLGMETDSRELWRRDLRESSCSSSARCPITMWPMTWRQCHGPPSNSLESQRRWKRAKLLSPRRPDVIVSSTSIAPLSGRSVPLCALLNKPSSQQPKKIEWWIRRTAQPAVQLPRPSCPRPIKGGRTASHVSELIPIKSAPNTYPVAAMPSLNQSSSRSEWNPEEEVRG